MKNICLLLFDLCILPITLIRLFFIYIGGSRYGVSSLQFLDVMQHARDPYFNQLNTAYTVDIEDADIRFKINQASRLSVDNISGIREDRKNRVESCEKCESIIDPVVLSTTDQKSEFFVSNHSVKDTNETVKETIQETIQKTIQETIKEPMFYIGGDDDDGDKVSQDGTEIDYDNMISNELKQRLNFISYEVDSYSDEE